MALPVLAAVLGGALATAGVVALTDDRRDEFVDSAEVAPAVFVDEGRPSFSMAPAQRRNDEDSDGDSDGDSEGDSDRRGGRLGRDRDRGRDDRVDRRDDRIGRRDAGVARIAFDNGFNDGYDRGLEDGRNRSRFDPTRHREYRNADRGYDGRLGSREEYRIVYRDGFRDGYDRGYRDGDNSAGSGRIRWPWPF